MPTSTREDCARVAAAALLQARDDDRCTLDVTGPALLSQADLARTAAEISGRPVEYVPISIDAAIAGLVAAGLPRPVAEIFASFDVAIARGLLAVVSDTVERLTGRAPRRVADFLAEHRAALVAQRPS